MKHLNFIQSTSIFWAQKQLPLPNWTCEPGGHRQYQRADSMMADSLKSPCCEVKLENGDQCPEWQPHILSH